MPAGSDSNSGGACIWLITCLLFLSILAGGGCLVAYMVLPVSQTAPWLPVLGYTLVGLPWAFWFLTFLYRIISRCCGYRAKVGVASGNGGGGGGGGGGSVAAVNRNQDVEAASQSKRSQSNRASSVASHESEMALANSMAS